MKNERENILLGDRPMDDPDKYIETRKKQISKFAKNFDKKYEQWHAGKTSGEIWFFSILF